MATTDSLKLSYQRLKQDHDISSEEDYQKVIERYYSHRRLFRRVHIRRRFRVKIPSLRRFLSRKARVLKSAWLKMCRRLKESQAHFGDIFAGNYLFMQVTPTPLKSSASSLHHYRNKQPFVYHKHHQTVLLHRGFSSTKYSVS